MDLGGGLKSLGWGLGHDMPGRGGLGYQLLSMGLCLTGILRLKAGLGNTRMRLGLRPSNEFLSRKWPECHLPGHIRVELRPAVGYYLWL